MKIKLLLLFILTLVISVIIYKVNQNTAHAATEPSIVEQKTNNKSVIYYFHGTFRCATCMKIEESARAVFEQNFKNTLEFKAVNIEEPENRHFVEDYQLVSKSLILSKIKDGKQVDYKNLNDMWVYIRDEQKFNTWLKEEISGFLLK